MNKFILIIVSITATITVSGCQQIESIKNDAQKVVTQTATQAENMAESIVDTKSKIDAKVKDVEAAASAIGKLAN